MHFQHSLYLIITKFPSKLFYHFKGQNVFYLKSQEKICFFAEKRSEKFSILLYVILFLCIITQYIYLTSKNNENKNLGPKRRFKNPKNPLVSILPLILKPVLAHLW